MKKRRILIVEDNKPFADALQYFLEDEGHEVWVIDNGKDVIPQAREKNADVILLDIRLPGEDGYLVAQHIREAPELQGVMLIAMSGYEQDWGRPTALFDRYFVKSSDPQELLRALQ